MKSNYLKFIEWNEDDQVFVGHCPDLFIGGACHGRNKQMVYAKLCRLVESELRDQRSRKAPLPPREAVVAIPLTV